MTHRTAQISAAIVSILQASNDLAIASIFPDREYSLLEDVGEMPCVCVNEGDDNPISDEGNDNVAFIDSQVEFETLGYAAGDSEAEVEAELRRQRRYIHKALNADTTLGLSFVIAIKYAGAGKSNKSAAGERMAGSKSSNWRVHYRMNFLDPG